MIAPRIALVFLIALLPAVADEVDRYVRAQMDEQHIPGLSLAVMRRGKPVKVGAYGYADLDRKTRVTRNTVFQLQSITKSFTATAIMMLVEDNQLSPNARIDKYLDGLPSSWDGITIRHLLTHTSGIKDFINEPTVDLAKDLEPRDVIRSLEKLPLNFKPGERYAYSNTGYHLLGMIIDKLTGMPWQEYLRTKIFKPLAMNKTDVNSATCELRDRALGYWWQTNGYQPGRYVAPTILGYAGGGILSTALDLAKWDAALHQDKLLSRSSLDEMWTPAKLNNGRKSYYGFGWSLEDRLGIPAVSHSGSHLTGFRSFFIRFPKHELSVTVLANSRSGNPANIAAGIAGFYLPELQLSKLKEQPDPAPERTEALKTALMSLAEGKECSLATPQFLATYRNANDRAQSLATRLKGMKSFAFLQSRDLSDYDIERHDVPVKDLCIYRLTTDSESRYYTFYLTSDGRLASYQSLAR